MITKERQDKLHEALELLNEAAREKRDEFFDTLGAKYGDLRKALLAKADEGRQALHDMDKKIRRNPWPYMGTAALGALIVGVLVAKKR